MSAHGDITRPWGDGVYTFRLAVGEIERLQDKLKTGPFELQRRIIAGQWRTQELREIIRYGLLGGGSVMKPDGRTLDDERINWLIGEYVNNRPWIQSVELAADILREAIFGPIDDPVPKSAAAEVTAPLVTTAESASPRSMDGGRSSATQSASSENSLYGNSQSARPDISAPIAASEKNHPPQPPMNSRMP